MRKEKRGEVGEIIEVGCALIVRDRQLLIAQRRPGGKWGGYWEFPGGKKEEGESIEECLVREADEELGVRVRPRELLMVKSHPRVTLRGKSGTFLELFFYICDWQGGVPVRKACHDFRWVGPEDLYRFLFLPGDSDVIQELNRKKRYWFRRGYLF